MKIIVDTDCGIDDALALLLLFSDVSKDVEVLGITCCHGNTTLDNVCTNVKKVLHLCQKTHVSVYRGCEGPIFKSRPVKYIMGEDGLGDSEVPYSTGDIQESPVPAVYHLVQMAKKHPEEIILIALAPMTNVAMAHRIDPQFTKNLKEIICMGGTYKAMGNVTEVAEFNFHCDPEAANIVLTEASCKITLAPWEMTKEHGIPWDTLSQLTQLNTPKARFTSNITKTFADRGKNKKRNKVFNDPDLVAVALALDPSIATSFIEHPLAVECEGEFTRGLTILLRSAPSQSKVKIVTEMDSGRLDEMRYQMLQ